MQNLHLKYHALVFDMDGTLADTMPTHFLAWTRSLRQHGIEFPEDRFYALGGVPAPDIIDMLAAEQGKLVDSHAMAEAKEALFIELLGEVKAIEPVLAIAAAHRAHMPMAIATGSPMWMAEKLLSALGIRDWFSAIVTADCVTKPKPHPETYLRAAALLEVDPKHCHAFEDTKLGVQSAKSAGMAVVDINLLK